MITVADAAKRLGISVVTVRRWCRVHGLGQMITDRMRMLSEADVDTLREIARTSYAGKRKTDRK